MNIKLLICLLVWCFLFPICSPLNAAWSDDPNYRHPFPLPECSKGCIIVLYGPLPDGKFFILPSLTVKQIVAALVLGLAPYLTPAQTEMSADLRVVEAERELAEEIRRLYLKAHVRYRMRDYAGAERFFGDCYALYQASREHFSGSSDLAALSEAMAYCFNFSFSLIRGLF